MALQKFVKRFLDWSGVFAYTGDGGRSMHALSTSTAGTVITEDTAITIPAFFHAIRLYGQVLGSLDWDLIQIDEKDNRTIARNHPIHRLLHDEPNEFQVASSFRETLIGHSITYGNGYAFIERNGNFRPTALLPLLPDRTYPTRHSGELKYITYVNGTMQTLEPYQVLHLPGFSTNGLTGVPLVKLMRETLGLTKAEELYASAYFGNGGNYGGFVKVAGKLEDGAMKNLRDSFQSNHGGLGNAFRWLFLEEGMTAQPNEVDAEKTQIVPARQFQLSDCARIVGLAPHLLYDLSRSTNNNIEQQGIEAVTYSFKPLANKLNQEAQRKLLYESERGIFEPRLDLKPLMVGTAKDQAETDQLRFESCAMTPNEIRAKDGRNPIEGGNQLFLNTEILPLNIAIQKALAEMEAQKMATAIGNAQASTTTDPTISKEETDAITEGVDKQPAEANDNPPPQGSALYDDGPKVPSDAEGIKQAGEEAIKMGLALSETDAAKVFEANEAMKKVSESITGIENQFVVALAPVLTELANKLSGLAPSAETMRSGIVSALKYIAEGVGYLVDAWHVLKLAGEGVSVAIVASIEGIIWAVKELADGVIWVANKMGADWKEPAFFQDTINLVDDWRKNVVEQMNGTVEQLKHPESEKWGQFFDDIQNQAQETAKKMADAKPLSPITADFTENAKKIKGILDGLSKDVADFGKTNAEKKADEIKDLGGNDADQQKAIALAKQLDTLNDQKKVMEELNKLQIELAQSGMDEAQKKADNLQRSGATEAQIAQAKALTTQIDAMKSWADEQKEASKMIADSMTGAEKFQSQVDKITKMATDGLLTSQQADDALVKASKELDKQDKDKKTGVEERRFDFRLPQEPKHEDSAEQALATAREHLKQAQDQSYWQQQLYLFGLADQQNQDVIVDLN